MFNYLCKLHMVGLILLTGIGMAQAQDVFSTAVEENTAACDIEISSPAVFNLFCGTTESVVYTITNNTPVRMDFDLDLVDKSAYGAVTIQSTTCPVSPTNPSNRSLPGGGTCLVTLLLTAPADAMACGGEFNWEFIAHPDSRGGCDAVREIHARVTEQAPPPPPPPPPPPEDCPGYTEDNILGAASQFIVLGGTEVTNSNNPEFTTLCFGDVGTYTGTVEDLTDVDNYPAPDCDGTGMVHLTPDADTTDAHDCVCTLIDTLTSQACMPVEGDLGSLNGGTPSFPTGGYYCFDGNTRLRGKLTLNAGAAPDTDKYYFIINGDFHVLAGTPENPMDPTSGPTAVILNGVDPDDVYWVVINSHTMDENPDPNAIVNFFQGNVLVSGASGGSKDIQIKNQAVINEGRVLTCNGEIDLDAVKIIGPNP